MKLTTRLLGYLHSAFDKDAHAFIAFRVWHTSGLFKWVVSERVMYGYDGDTLLFSIDLSQHTIETLCGALLTKPGVSISYTANRSDLDISACALLDGAGAIAASNGDCVRAYTSTIWMYVDALATELATAKASIAAALAQMNLKTSGGEWVDEWGGYFDIPRAPGELDAAYANRIVIEVFQPRGNNKAIEIALKRQFLQDFAVVDVVKYLDALVTHNGTQTYDGEISPGVPLNYNAANKPVYGLFQVVAAYNLESGLDMLAYAAAVRAFVNKFRDAGMQLDSLLLSGSSLADTCPPPTDSPVDIVVDAPLADTAVAPTEAMLTAASLADMSDASTAPTEAGLLDISYATTFNGLRSFDGTRQYMGGIVDHVAL